MENIQYLRVTIKNRRIKLKVNPSDVIENVVEAFEFEWPERVPIEYLIRHIDDIHKRSDIVEVVAAPSMKVGVLKI